MRDRLNNSSTGRARPRIVFLDVGQWDAFVQFAAALRRRGVRVERVTLAPHNRRDRLRRMTQRLVYSQTDSRLRFDAASREVTVDEVRTRLAGSAAVEAVDVVAEALARTPGYQHRAVRSGSDGVLYDKLAMTRCAESLGIGVPETWDELPVGLEDPLVLKRRLGSGGTDVRVVRDPGEVPRAWAEVGGDGLALAQRFAPGDVLSACGVARDGEILQAGCYRMNTIDGGWLGPARQIDIITDDEVSAAARTLLAHLGYTGIFCIQFIRTCGCAPLWIDFNSRVFGSWLALQRAGLDIIGAYLLAYGLSENAVHGAARPRLAVTSNPHRPPDGRWSVPAYLEVLRASRVLGMRWLIASSAETMLGAASRTLLNLPARLTAAQHAQG